MKGMGIGDARVRTEIYLLESGRICALKVAGERFLAHTGPVRVGITAADSHEPRVEGRARNAAHLKVDGLTRLYRQPVRVPSNWQHLLNHSPVCSASHYNQSGLVYRITQRMHRGR